MTVGLALRLAKLTEPCRVASATSRGRRSSRWWRRSTSSCSPAAWPTCLLCGPAWPPCSARTRRWCTPIRRPTTVARALARIRDRCGVGPGRPLWTYQHVPARRWRSCSRLTVEWPRTLYEAFTPMMDQDSAAAPTTFGTSEPAGTRTAGLRYGHDPRDLAQRKPRSARPWTGGVSTAFRSPSIDEYENILSVPYGPIRLVDGAGTHEGRFDDWHII